MKKFNENVSIYIYVPGKWRHFMHIWYSCMHAYESAWNYMERKKGRMYVLWFCETNIPATSNALCLYTVVLLRVNTELYAACILHFLYERVTVTYGDVLIRIVCTLKCTKRKLNAIVFFTTTYWLILDWITLDPVSFLPNKSIDLQLVVLRLVESEKCVIICRK